MLKFKENAFQHFLYSNTDHFKSITFCSSAGRKEHLHDKGASIQGALNGQSPALMMSYPSSPKEANLLEPAQQRKNGKGFRQDLIARDVLAAGGSTSSTFSLAAFPCEQHPNAFKAIALSNWLKLVVEKT